MRGRTKKKKSSQQSIETGKKLVRCLRSLSFTCFETRCRHQGELLRSSRHKSAKRNGACSPRAKGENKKAILLTSRKKRDDHSSTFLSFLSLSHRKLLTSLEALASLLASASPPPPSLSEEEEEGDGEERLLFFFSFFSFFLLSFFFDEEPSPRPMVKEQRGEKVKRRKKSDASEKKNQNSFFFPSRSSFSSNSRAPARRLSPGQQALAASRGAEEGAEEQRFSLGRLLERPINWSHAHRRRRPNTAAATSTSTSTSTRRHGDREALPAFQGRGGVQKPQGLLSGALGHQRRQGEKKKKKMRRERDGERVSRRPFFSTSLELSQKICRSSSPSTTSPSPSPPPTTSRASSASLTSRPAPSTAPGAC